MIELWWCVFGRRSHCNGRCSWHRSNWCNWSHFASRYVTGHEQAHIMEDRWYMCKESLVIFLISWFFKQGVLSSLWIKSNRVQREVNCRLAIILFVSTLVLFKLTRKSDVQLIHHCWSQRKSVAIAHNKRVTTITWICILLLQQTTETRKFVFKTCFTCLYTRWWAGPYHMV